MVKKDKKTEAAKKEAKKARQAAKQQKTTAKRSKKEAKETGEDIESILKEFSAKEAAKTAVTISVSQQPSRRANFTMTSLPGGDMLMFGGEYFDGDRAEVYSDVYRWNVDKNEWRLIESLNTPPPRCSHQAVFYQDKIYMFGGEYATADQFYHFRDLWCLDLKTHAWREIRPTGECPSGRSGHRMVVWRNYLILFGGFYEAMREVRWYNDLYFFSFQEEKWIPMIYKPNIQVPRPRSGVQMCVNVAEDTLYIVGGYSKEKTQGANKEGRIHEDMWMLHLKPALPSSKQGSTGLDVSKLSWQKVSRKGDYPSKRSSAVMTVYKNKALTFGGVHDVEGVGHAIASTFFNDLHAFDLERRRWYQLGLRSAKAKKDKTKKSGGSRAEGHSSTGASGEKGGDDDDDHDNDDDEEEEEDDDEEEHEGQGGSAANASSRINTNNMFGYIDESGNVVYIPLEDLDDIDATLDQVAQVSLQDSATVSSPQPMAAPDIAESSSTGTESTVAPPSSAEATSFASSTAAPTEATKGEIHPETDIASSAGRDGGSAPQLQEEKVAGWMKFLVDRTDPCPRINPCIMIRGNSLVIYGGVTEIGDVEVTLDDCWSLDLNKRDHWKNILPGTMHTIVWKGVEDDDESSRFTGERGDSDVDSDSDGDDDDEEDDDENDDDEEEECDEDAPRAKERDRSGKNADVDKKHKKKSSKDKEGAPSLRAEMESLRAHFDITDGNRTPLAGEALRAFYQRTAEYWAGQVVEAWQQKQALSGESVHKSEILSEKEIKKQGFALAELRYNELLPILSRLNELEAQQAEEEEDGEGGRRGRRERDKAGKDKKSKR